ncbi:unnamed protein product [Ectocarpus sp. CCAP 1310/34]|nr:unnamed protein product [Ectocarpus sp. CCAP 1310/34]
MPLTRVCGPSPSQVIIEFLKTGRYRWWVPFCASVRFTDGRAPKANDFVGLNYYSHYYASLWSVIFEPDMEEKLRALPAETMTDMPHCIYPEGLYCALKAMSVIGHPIYVTENGIADADDTRRRCVAERPRGDNPNDQGNRTTSSYVTFTETLRLISEASKNLVAMDASNTIFDAKRLIGRKFADPTEASDMKHRPFDVAEGPGGKPMIECLLRARRSSSRLRNLRHGAGQAEGDRRGLPRQGGYGPRFGLFEVDFGTQRRTLRDSSKYYVEVVKKHSGKKSSSGLAPDTTDVGEGNVIGTRAVIYHKLKSSANVSEDVLRGGGGGAEPGEIGERDGVGEPPACYSVV